MWLSEKMAGSAPQDLPLAGGVVTVGGQTPAVTVDGEERNARIASPGGYYWRPAPSDPVVVSRSGGLTILGRLQENTPLSPGEICISTGRASIRLLPDGAIRLEGEIFINGTKLELEEA